MPTDKQSKNKPAQQDQGKTGNKQPGQDAPAVELNPNPRANDNISDDQKKRAFGKKGGADSEITDGEDG